ncbi:MAG: DUF3489 domain-containing protein [Pseudomonadota bacterium]|nr:DUF3489 domain-containing protein [Pseudomonadota bacterium]MDP2351612.1 DUF3489 domain-containing protein [Pseudomonadota bacterium]
MIAKLTPTQTAIVEAAAGRTDGNIEPLPATLRGGARTKVIEGLIAKGLVTGTPGRYLLTDTGYAAISKQRPAASDVQNLDTTDGLQEPEPIPRAIRPSTKLAGLIDALRQPGGATVSQIMAATQWQAHTVRGAISGMVRKKLGYNVVSEKRADGDRLYRIA